MELEQYLRIIRRYWRSVVAVILVTVCLAATLTLLQRPTYSASTSLFLTVESGGTAGELSQGATYAERQVKSYANVGRTAVVLQPVIDELALQMTPAQLAQRITVTSPASTSVIDVAAQASSAEAAAQIANAVGESLVEAVSALSPLSPTGVGLVKATVTDPAVVPATPISPRPLTNLLLGTLLGAMLGVGQALLRSVLDTRMRSTKDVEALTDAPILASIGSVESSPSRASDQAGQQWANAEAYRRLRTNVGFVGLGGERRSSIVMTSSVGGEGKTQTAVNLAQVLAEAGESVLLVDADLRRPQVAARMELDSDLGLSDVLTGRGTLGDLIVDVIPGQLSVLPAGTVPPNPSELLGSEALAHLLAAVERQYDHVLFDAPPLLPVTDSVVLAAQTGGAIMVARSGVVKRPEFEAAQRLLKAGNVTLLGIVLNDVPARNRSYGAYGSYAGHYMPRPNEQAEKPKPTRSLGRRLGA